MAKRSKKRSGSKGILVLMITAFLGAGVLAAYVRFNPSAAHVAQADRFDQPEVIIQSRKVDHSASIPLSSAPNNILVPALQNNEVVLARPLGPVPDGIKPEVYVVNETLSSLLIDKAKVLDISVTKGLALIHCTSEIQKGYGTMEEGNLIKSLQMALGQFKQINSYQLVIEGHTVESLGNIDLTTPVKVIRPGQTEPTNDEGPIPPKPS